MKEIKIVSRYDKDKVLVCGKYESIKDCLEKNRGADLRGADLRGAKNYYMSHDFCQEIVRRQPVKTFTAKEWEMIGRLAVHRFCWEEIKKRYGKKIMPFFKKISKLGFNEYEKHYKGLL